MEFPIVTLNLFFIPYTSRLLTIIPFSSSFFLNFRAEILHLSKFNNKKLADTLLVFILFFSKLLLSFSAHFLLCLIDFDINMIIPNVNDAIWSDENLIKEFKDEGYLLCAWGAKSINDVKNMNRINLDGMTVDWPGKALKAIL